MKGAVDTVTLPSNIAPGNYLIRHEILGLHLSTSKGGAEFYPACAQLKVGGSGTGTPKQSELVSFPGGYSDDDPGIFDPSIFDEDVEYVFPGPAVAAFVGDGGNGGGSGGNGGNGGGNGGSGGASSTSGSGSAKPTPTSKAPRPTSSSSSGSSSSNANPDSSSTKCKLRKVPKSASLSARSPATPTGRSLDVKYYPRHISRVMRSIAFGRDRKH